MGRGKAKSTPVREYIPIDPGVEWRHRKTEFNELWSNREIVDIHERIEQKVYEMAKEGIPMHVIADFFAVDREQLANHYHEAWRVGHPRPRTVPIRLTYNSVGLVLAAWQADECDSPLLPNPARKVTQTLSHSSPSCAIIAP